MEYLTVEVSDEVAAWLKRVGSGSDRSADQQAAHVLDGFHRLAIATPPQADEPEAWLDVGACEGCGYLRTGLPPGRPCPECGRPPAPRHSFRPCPECGLSMLGRSKCGACSFATEADELFLWEFDNGVMPIDSQKRRHLRIATRGYSLRRGTGRASWQPWNAGDKIFVTSRGLRVDRRFGPIPIYCRFEFAIPDEDQARHIADRVAHFATRHA